MHVWNITCELDPWFISAMSSKDVVTRPFDAKHLINLISMGKKLFFIFKSFFHFLFFIFKSFSSLLSSVAKPNHLHRSEEDNLDFRLLNDSLVTTPDKIFVVFVHLQEYFLAILNLETWLLAVSQHDQQLIWAQCVHR